MHCLDLAPSHGFGYPYAFVSDDTYLGLRPRDYYQKKRTTLFPHVFVSSNKNPQYKKIVRLSFVDILLVTATRKIPENINKGEISLPYTLEEIMKIKEEVIISQIPANFCEIESYV